MQKPFSDIKINTNPEISTEQVQKEPSFYPEKKQTKTKAKTFLWIFAVLSVIALFFGISGYFTKATVFISPQVKIFSFKNEAINFSRESKLGVNFEIMSLKGYVESEIHLDNTSTVSRKSKGKITIFNKEIKPISIPKNTILKGSNGLNYKLTESVVVPKMESGIGSVGSIDANIEAVDFGDNFDSKPMDFTFPSFSKTSRFENVYARSTSDLLGGIKGTVYTLDEGLYKAELSKLDESLKDKLFIQAQSQAPSGYILYKDLSVLVPEEKSSFFESKNSEAIIKREGKLVVYMVLEDSILEYVKTTTKTDLNIKDFNVPELKNLNFTFNQNPIDPENSMNIDVIINADGRIVSNINKKELTDLLIGVPKNSVEKMLENYISVSSAVTKITPIWQSTLPKDQNRLEIIVNPPKELTL